MNTEEVIAEVNGLIGKSREAFFQTLASGITADDLRVLAEQWHDKLTLKDVARFIRQESTRASEDTIRMLYKEYGDQIRHFSTVRSALTTFLLTVALAAFSAYFNINAHPPFLIVSALIFLVAALAICLAFSYRTEKAVIRYKRIWPYLSGTDSDANSAITTEVKSFEIWQKMLADFTNYMLLAGVLLILLAFYRRDNLLDFLHWIRLM